MADYYPEEASQRQREILERVQKIADSIRKDVLDYYWDSYPETPEHKVRNEDGIRKYMKYAYDDIGTILTDLERDLDI
jgi:hypothetical protein